MSKAFEKTAISWKKTLREKTWPVWPRADESTEKLLKDVLYSGRWALSGQYTGKKPYERQFAEAFAKFNDVPFCVPVCNGSAALTIALEALGAGFGKEVIIPGLTWVACASSVLRVGAVPVLVDIEPDTLCISVESVQKAITKKTAGIMIVHLYSSLADIDAFIKLSQETGIPIIEDCSHAHGAIWKGKRVGTFGKIGVFSMQQSKLLTCGEGGAAITSDAKIYDKLQQLRADGRRYVKSPVIGQMELEEIGSVQGYNYCLSEFHAAILLDRLKYLDEENRIREENAKYLDTLLSEIKGVKPIKRRTETDLQTYYKYCIRLNREAFGNYNIELIGDALALESGIPIETIYMPLHCNVLYKSDSSLTAYKQVNLPISKEAKEKCLTISHDVLLAGRKDMENIAEAFVKIKHSSD